MRCPRKGCGFLLRSSYGEPWCLYHGTVAFARQPWDLGDVVCGANQSRNKDLNQSDYTHGLLSPTEEERAAWR